MLMPWQTPQMVLAQNNASEGATWWVNRREKMAPAMHTTASRTLAPKTPEISAESRLRVIAVARGLSRGGDVEAVLDDAGDHIPDRLGKHHDSPPGRTQHVGQVRKREQRQGVGACLHPVERDNIVDEAAAMQLFGIRSGAFFDRGLRGGLTGTSQ